MIRPSLGRTAIANLPKITKLAFDCSKSEIGTVEDLRLDAYLDPSQVF